MSQIATTREQGKRLIAAGVSMESADMSWDKYGNSKWALWAWWTGRNVPGLKVIPAWSLSALWQIVHNLDKTYEFPTHLSAEELIETLVTTICYRYELR